MTSGTRLEQACAIKAALNGLYEDACDANLKMVAHMIGVALEAVAEVTDRPQPKLRLLKGGLG